MALVGRVVRWLAGTAVSTLATAAIAAAPLVDARLSVVMIQSNGQFETNAPAASARPGDTLEYAARYSNRGDAAATFLMPSMPIPAGTEYVPSNATPKPTHASLDGIAFAPIPLRRKLVGADGIARDVDIAFAEYRALRWTVGTLGAGHEVTVRARVRIVPPLVADR